MKYLKTNNIVEFEYCVLQQADMVFSGLTITKERSEAVDFSYPFFEEPSNVVLRVWDHKESYFYKPLHWKVCSKLLYQKGVIHEFQ